MLAKQMRDLLEQDVTEEYMLIDGKPPKVLARRGHKPGLASSPVRLARAGNLPSQLIR